MNNLDNILNSKYRDLLVSLPVDLTWLEYIQNFINLKSEAEYFKIELSGTPKTRIEKKCYLVYDDEVKGWMYISEIHTKNDIFTLNLIPYLYSLEKKIKIKPFSGFKYYYDLPNNEKQ